MALLELNSDYGSPNYTFAVEGDVYKMTILNVQPSDDGDYQCSARGGGDTSYGIVDS